MSTALHRQLSIAILQFLKKTTKDELLPTTVASTIMSGVSAHISITNPEIRKFGLEIGERISKILLPDHPAKFDELHAEEEEKQEKEPQKFESIQKK